jgi:hypothetical protein
MCFSKPKEPCISGVEKPVPYVCQYGSARIQSADENPKPLRWDGLVPAPLIHLPVSLDQMNPIPFAGYSKRPSRKIMDLQVGEQPQPELLLLAAR